MSGVVRIRDVQGDIIASVPNCYDAGDISAIELRDALHPSVTGSKEYARVVAGTFVRVVRSQQAAA
jgi:hypothetical protein